MDHRLHSVNPPATTRTNDLARRVALQQTVTAMLDHEPSLVQSDADRLALLQSRIGAIADAYLHAHTDIDAEVLKLWASVQSWAEQRAREAAR